jgi:hypothetical protein
MSEQKDWRTQLREKAELVNRALDNETGQAFLAMLEETFQRGVLYHENPTKMGYNVGQHELVEYLKTMMEAAKNG